MRDSHATAMPADMPVTRHGEGLDTVLPYDPDDWERRLADARVRRAAVLRARASSSPETASPVAPVFPVGPAASAGPALVPRARAGDRGPRAGTAHADPDAWRRRLAEARGLTPPPSPAPVTPSQGGRMARDDTSSTLPHTVVADTPREPAPLPAAAQGRPVLRVAALAGLTGLATGLVLAAGLIDHWSSVAPIPSSGAGQMTASAPAGMPPVTVQTAAFVPPTPPAQSVRTHSMPTGSVQDSIRGAAGPARHALPAMPAMPDTRLVDVTLPPPDMPPVATAGEVTPFVVVHVPPVPARAGTTDLMAESAARGWAVVPVGFTVSRSHLRVYHAADRPAAATLGERLGLPIRDFTGEIPAPSGLIEVWVAGGAGSDG